MCCIFFYRFFDPLIVFWTNRIYILFSPFYNDGLIFFRLATTCKACLIKPKLNLGSKALASQLNLSLRLLVAWLHSLCQPRTDVSKIRSWLSIFNCKIFLNKCCLRTTNNLVCFLLQTFYNRSMQYVLDQLWH